MRLNNKKNILFLKNKEVTTVQITILCISVSLFFIVYGFYGGELYSWEYTQFLFDYRDEFLKRGLVGEVIRQLGYQMSYDLATKLSYGIFFGVCIALLIVTIAPFKGYWRHIGFFGFFLFVFSHSGTIQHFYADFQHMDGINFVLALLSLFLIYKINKPYKYIFVYLLMAIATLIHEAVLFMYIPLVLIFSFYLDSTKENILQLLCLLGALLCTVYAVSIFGLAKNSTLEEHYTKLISTYGIYESEANKEVYKDSVAVVHNRGLKDNADLVLERIAVDKNHNNAVKRNHIKLFIILIPTFLIYISLVSEEIKKHGKTKELLLLLSALSPLCLYPIGYDFFRWWALALTNLFTITALIAWLDNQFRASLISLFYRHQVIVFIAIFFSLKAGGIEHVAHFAGN
ncbi:hypothetical protein [Candidatus Nitrosacidococcus tergens]|uniref:EpsG family protein n=1 Tax=Candidatus Nitrosacidococcus tergens TaxID=553981 RepID=A0A7G1QAP3_9GAMM|nr:hypothetical protein [Candidatus Nitrosacidococcus tergens]CAB1276807.1 membrane protein of unknown function [Candidatus Nitrosacidococcus tergens]